jgi:anti-anti-sigma factor
MQNQALEIEKVADSKGATVLRLHGPLLLGNFFAFQSTVRGDDAELLIVDLADVPYIDSAGIGCLVGAQVSRNNSGRTLVLIGTPDRVLTSLKVTKVAQLFKYASSVEEAHTMAPAKTE